ncbi:hypothetical protein K8Z61_00350 [Nocardioides sp. TRM66260-LWL]|uniref:hypothetical protein n=1 Tax=Nocardioides sp. TRM66260-LWL TaxID=2874478 RepID=UPI001CC60A7B|nr:hypothetical protein [Nocardioides sp. TRM66260-LWL]MBZ5732937.1 hypothetical protein [Nocardioides sp. TRM66260-LWL]
MISEISHRMAGQNGLVLRAQLVGEGVAGVSVDRALRSGELMAVRRSVYTTGEAWEAASLPQRAVMQVRAASALVREPHVISHDSAALLLGLPTLRQPVDLVHLTRFGVHGGRTRHGVKHHKAPFEAWQVEGDLEEAWFGVERVAADIAREHGLRAGLVAFDAARRRGARVADLQATVAAMRSWPGVTVVREALELSDGRAESPGESLTRLMLVQLGAGPVEPQFGLRRDGRTVWGDLRIGRLVVEFDGRVKYRSIEDGGLAARAVEEIVLEEKVREDFIRSFGLIVIRIVWEDLRPDQWRATQARLRRALAHADALYGRDLSDLAAYRVGARRVA